MASVTIRLNSIGEVKEFNRIAATVPGDVDLHSGRYCVDAKSIMGIFALFTALLVVVLGYLCIQIYTIFHRTYKTETAIAYTMLDVTGNVDAGLTAQLSGIDAAIRVRIL